MVRGPASKGTIPAPASNRELEGRDVPRNGYSAGSGSYIGSWAIQGNRSFRSTSKDGHFQTQINRRNNKRINQQIHCCNRCQLGKVARSATSSPTTEQPAFNHGSTTDQPRINHNRRREEIKKGRTSFGCSAQSTRPSHRPFNCLPHRTQRGCPRRLCCPQPSSLPHDASAVGQAVPEP